MGQLRERLGISSDSAREILMKHVHLSETGQLDQCPHCNKPLTDFLEGGQG